MSQLGSKGLKRLKMLHLFCAVMWIGGAIALCLTLFLTTPENGSAAYMRSLVLKIIDDYIIIPGAVGNLLVGVIYGVWTKWGFFKQRWITVKWVLTVAQVLFGTFVLGPWVNANVKLASELGDAVVGDPLFLHNIMMSKFWGSIQTACLLLYIVISVLKPWKKILRAN